MRTVSKKENGPNPLVAQQQGERDRRSSKAAAVAVAEDRREEQRQEQHDDDGDEQRPDQPARVDRGRRPDGDDIGDGQRRSDTRRSATTGQGLDVQRSRPGRHRASPGFIGSTATVSSRESRQANVVSGCSGIVHPEVGVEDSRKDVHRRGGRREEAGIAGTVDGEDVARSLDEVRLERLARVESGARSVVAEDDDDRRRIGRGEDPIDGRDGQARDVRRLVEMKPDRVATARSRGRGPSPGSRSADRLARSLPAASKTHGGCGAGDVGEDELRTVGRRSAPRRRATRSSARSGLAGAPRRGPAPGT